MLCWFSVVHIAGLEPQLLQRITTYVYLIQMTRSLKKLLSRENKYTTAIDYVETILEYESGVIISDKDMFFVSKIYYRLCNIHC